MKTKALILAAGFGSRLAPLTNDIPKTLVPVNGIPILIMQIENLINNGIKDIAVVAGYKSDVIVNTIKNSFPFVKIIDNTNYQISNNMFSAYLDIKTIGFENMIMMNGDVFFDSSVLTALLKFEHGNAIVVDIGKYNKESMKVIEKNGRIMEISKTITKIDSLGCSIDIYKFDKNGVKAFFEMCVDYIKKEKNLKNGARLLSMAYSKT